MYTFDVNFALLIAVFAGFLAVFFDYFPWVAGKFDQLDESQKKLINVGGVVVLAVAIFVGDCYNLFNTNLECTVKGAIDLLGMIVLGVAANYGTHKATKPSDGFKSRMFGGPAG